MKNKFTEKEWLIIFSVVLTFVGLINVFNASSVIATNNYNNLYYFLKKQFVADIIGFILLIFFANRKPEFWQKNSISFVFFILTVIMLILVKIPGIGISVNGAYRWLPLGITTFQPSELAKFSTIIITSTYINNYIKIKKKIIKLSLISAPFFLTILMSLLVLLEPDMGTSIVIIGLCLAIYFLVGIRNIEQKIFFIISLMVVFILSTQEVYRLDRLKAWFNPWAFSRGIGYQSCQSLLAIGSGKIFGSGFGQGISKFFYLPEAHTDFAFAIWAQDTGFIGSLFLIVIYFLFLTIIFRIAVNTKNLFEKLLSFGICALLVGQALINILMVIGLLPVVGVPLPFISYGGTSIIVNLISVGILYSISNNKIIHKENNLT